LEFYGPQLDFKQRQGDSYKMVVICPGTDLFFNGKITVDSVHHPWTAGMPVHDRLAMTGQRGLTRARPSGRSRAWWLTGGGAIGRGVHGESTSGLTRARAVVWRPVDGGEETAEEALDAGGAWARREDKASGERCGGERGALPLYRGRGGGRRLVIKTEKQPALMGMKWLAFK
jgi:hypothetical protein